MLRLSAWLVDYMKDVMIYSILSNRCPVCIAPPNKFEGLLDTPYNIQQYF
ncbi:hypothetical protein BGX38DRAFT_1108662 [Terfezia claveryi]|nr:hypothetical protein BGX38DRAFT_1108662 [Terfezia claveryi]